MFRNKLGIKFVQENFFYIDFRIRQHFYRALLTLNNRLLLWMKD
jgi:hypothetical protein